MLNEVSVTHGADSAPPSDPELAALARSEVVQSGVAPCAVVGCAWRGQAGWRTAFGAAGRVNAACAATVTTPFDLASLTKPFLAVAIARACHAGRLTFQDRLRDLLPEVRGTSGADLTLELLLSHRAGLEAHVGLFADWQQGRALRYARLLANAASARRADCASELSPAGFAPLYSDLGYVLAGAAVARALDTSVEQLISAWVSAPLGLDVGSARQWQASSHGFVDRVAPSEIAPQSSLPVRGRVHDENAWALAGFGVCGHAGLFGSALSVVRFGAACLDALHGRSAWLERAAFEPLSRARPGTSYAMGFDTKTASGSSAGQMADARTFGHLGFTGTSLWCDPAAERVLVLLTNRVCPSRRNEGIRAARPRVHDALQRYCQQHSAD